MSKTTKTRKSAKTSTTTPLTTALGLLQPECLGESIRSAVDVTDAAIVQGLTLDHVIRAVEHAAERQNGRLYRTARKGFEAMPFSETNEHVSTLRAMEMEAAFGVGFVVAARLFGGVR